MRVSSSIFNFHFRLTNRDNFEQDKKKCFINFRYNIEAFLVGRLLMDGEVEAAIEIKVAIEGPRRWPGKGV